MSGLPPKPNSEDSLPPSKLPRMGSIAEVDESDEDFFMPRAIPNAFTDEQPLPKMGGEPSLPKIGSNKPVSDDPVLNDFQDEAFVRTVSKNDYTHVDDLLTFLVENKGSDLHLTANSKPMYRVRGDVSPIPGYNVLSATEVKRVIYEMMPPNRIEEFEESKELNMAYALPNIGRFRVNVFQQRETVAAVVRYIPNDIIPLEDLHMPEVLAEFADYPRGLVLITGPTGSGKSTTLAAIINEINMKRSDHIITIEDPIEFVHKNNKSIINQREVGVDTETFQTALKNSLRQDPDVILLGEMRDLETISTALTAAETGHLVFGTLHTQSATETISRIIDVFPEGAKGQVRTQLAATLQAIACQTLIKTIDGSARVAALEILKANGAIRNLIRKNNDEQIRTMMETSKGVGMQTLDSHLIELVKSNTIPVDEALVRSNTADILINALGGEAGINKIRRQQESMGGAKV